MTELLLLTIDSLRSDRFDRERFSECWGAFETDFVRFERAMANGVATPLSFPSLLTGCPAAGDGTLPPDRPTLAELYDGYAWAASNNPHLRAERNYDRGFDWFADDPAALVEDGAGCTARDGSERDTDDATRRVVEAIRNAEETLDRPYGGEHELTPPPSSARHVLAALRAAMAEREGFFWAHFIDPHYQFKPRKVLDRELRVDRGNDEILAANERYVDGDPEPGDVEFLSRLYDEQIAYLDRRLAAFFEYLRAEGRWDETAIVIAADHGEAFGERGVYNHEWDADPIDALVRVPLLVKFPGNRRGGEAIDRLVQNADVLPTLAAELGWDVDRPPTARPLLDDDRRVVVSKSTAAVRVTTEVGRAIRRRDGTRETTGTVGDDALDALESASIPAVEKLSGTVPGLDEDERGTVEQRLEDLGYM